MGTYTWRDRLRDWLYNACHPIDAAQRTSMARYCARHNLVLIHIDDWWAQR